MSLCGLRGPGVGLCDSMGVRQAARNPLPRWGGRGQEPGDQRVLGPPWHLRLALTSGGRRSVWRSPQEAPLKCRWTRDGQVEGTGLGCRLETLPRPQPLEGGIISPPFRGVALLVAITAGVSHVVQRHHHLIWARVFVQLHHARHHRGPAIPPEAAHSV